MTSESGEATMSGESSGDPDGPIDRRKAEEMLLILGRLGRAVHDALADRVEPGLAGNAEVFVIVRLHLRGPQRPSDIVSAIGMSSGGVTKLIDRLEVGGYIGREFGTIENDRRGTRLVLTPKGADLAQEYADALLSELDEVRDAIERLRSLVW